jgi:PAS domain S-box-containing protein
MGETSAIRGRDDGMAVDAVVLIQDDQVVWANESALRLCGATRPGDVIGRPFLELIHADDQAAAAELRQVPVAGAPAALTELRIQRLNGELVPVLAASVAGRHKRRAASCVSMRVLPASTRAVEALRTAYDRSRTLFDPRIATIGITVVNAKGDVIEANDHYLGILGCTRGELEEGCVRWLEMTPPEWLPADRRALAQLRKRGVCDTYEKEYVRRDGSRVPVLATGAMLPGAKTEILAFVVDISERKRLERLYAVLSQVNEAIVRARERQPLLREVCRIVAEVGHFPLAWIGLTSGREVIPEACGGREADYLSKISVEVDGELGTGPTGTCIREDRPVVNDDFASNAETSPWREAALRHGFRASAAFPLHQDAKAVGALTLYAKRPGAFDAAHVKLLESLSADVSYALLALDHEKRRSEAEQSLRLQSSTASELLRAAGLGEIFELLAQRIYAAAQGAVVTVTEFDSRTSEVVIRRLQCTPEDYQQATTLFGRDPVGLRLSLSAETRRRWKPGELTLVPSLYDLLFRHLPKGLCEKVEHNMHLGDIFGMACAHDEDILGTVAVITRSRGPLRHQKLIEALVAQAALALQRLRAEEALREADHRKNEFLAVLSHELRNPLAPISNSLFILKRAPAGCEQARRALEVIDRQAEQLSNLVNDLLDVTRITRNKIQLQKERLELNAVVRRAAEDSLSFFDKVSVGLDVTLARGPVYVDADRTRISQVIGNLLQNAAKFARPAGSAAIRVSVEGREAVVGVIDDGVGMAPQTLERLFQPFMQAEQTLDRSSGGLGLGLALVKGLVELHGGSISATSDGLGRGAAFVMRLPLDAGAGAAPRASTVPTIPLRRRVLIIEDNVDAADTLREAIEMREHEVEVAYNGPDGIAKARAFRPEVVLCDIGLPGMDGYQVARTLRADASLDGTMLVALTGYALPEDLQRAAEAGFAQHLAKPPTLEKLEALLGGSA